MSLLSDEKIKEILIPIFMKQDQASIHWPDIFEEVRAIEAAVLEAQKQEPWPFSADRVTYHKAAPVVQPDMIRPDQEALQQIIAAALYDFGGFITTRQKQLVASATDNAADTVDALKEFMEKRGINPCQDVPVLSWQCWIAAAEGEK